MWRLYLCISEVTKVAFLNPTIPPRAVALLNRINAQPNIAVKGLFFAISQKNRYWQLSTSEYEKITFPYKIVNSISLGFGIKDYHNTFISFKIFRELSKFNPDVVIVPGWSDVNSFFALLWVKFFRKKIILRTESTNNEKSWRRSLFIPYIKLFCHLADLIIGCSEQASYFARSMANSACIVTIYSSFDTIKFNQKVMSLDKKTIRKQLGVTQSQVVYFNGQLIKRKGVIELLDAFSHISLNQIALIITGDGQLRDQVKQSARHYSNIYYFGYQKQNVLPKYYRAADVFILPSFEETWGLVTIEAMAAELPIIISQKAGSVELVESNQSGFVLPDITAKEIRTAVRYFSNDKNFASYGHINKTFALKELSYEKIAQQFSDVIYLVSK
ncbi:MAG: glycosyltransferase family 4 protein [Patescibacteria group bacterium]